MKKIFTSIVVIGSFVVYVLIYNKKSESVETPVILQLNLNKSSTNTSSTSSSFQYKDGEYTGSVTDAFYGNIQVKAIIQNGKLVDVAFLQYPNRHHHSVEINTVAMPILRQEAITAQSAEVDIVTRATDTSSAFRQSLSEALGQAKN